MNTLIFDTATTGRFHFDLKTDHPMQPHLLRLAWRVEDEPPQCHLIIPAPSWMMAPDAQRAHGISFAQAARSGVPILAALKAFADDLARATDVLAFGADFHHRAIQREVLTMAIDMPWPKYPLCVMKAATPIVRKPRTAPGGGFAYPKLGEAFRHFSGGLPMLGTDTIDLVSIGKYRVRVIQAIHRQVEARKDSTRQTEAART